MKLFNVTMQTIKDFDNIVKAANETFAETKKKVMETYKEPIAAEKIREAREALTEVHIRETQKASHAVQEDFYGVRSKVNEVVTASAPVDFAATLAAIQAKGRNVTDYEANAYIEKYKNNYLAFSTLLDVLHQAGKAVDVIAYKPDAIEARISEIEKMVLNWIQCHASSNDDGYITAILMDDNHSLIMKLAVEVQAFMDGGYILGDDGAGQMVAALDVM